MAEDHSLHHEFEDLDGLKPQEIASMRWQAIEGLICLPGLSSTARRVCILLITTMDNKTRRSFRGERRIAAELGVHLSAVKKAKAELKDAELITWFNPGGPRHLSHYNFNWEALRRHSREAKDRGDAIVAETISQRRQGTRTGTYQPRPNSTPQGTYERDVDVTVTGSKVPKTEFQGTQISSQGTPQGTAMVPPRVPNLTHDLALNDLAQHITPSQADDGLGSAKDLNRPFVSQRAREEAEAKGALEEKDPIYPRPLPPRPQEKSKPILQCFYPKLLEELGNVASISVIIGRLDFEQQTEASKLLNMKGKGREAALAFILEQGKQGAAA